MQERLHFLHLDSGDAAAAHCVTTSVALEAERPVGDDGWRPSTPTTAQSQTSELAQWIVSEVEAHTICIVQHPATRIGLAQQSGGIEVDADTTGDSAAFRLAR